MLFSRRDKARIWEKLRVALWPRRSWWRSIQYLGLRVVRLTASPHAIAAGVAAGCYASFTPFFGFHFVVAFLVATLIGGSYIAAATGTFFGNPLTFPIIILSAIQSGSLVLGTGSELSEILRDDHGRFALSSLFHLPKDIFVPLVQSWLTGSLLVGIPVSCIIYLFVRQAARLYKASRLKKLADRARLRMAERIEEDLASDDAGRTTS